MPVETDAERLAREFRSRDMRTYLGRIDVDGVSAGRLDDRNAGLQQVLTKICDAANPVLQVVFVEYLDESLGHRLQVTAGQSAVRDEALGEDQKVVGSAGQRIVSQKEYAAGIDQPVFLGAHRGAIGQ